MARGSWGGALDAHVFKVKIAMSLDTNKFQTGFHLRDVGVQALTPQNVADEVTDFVNDSFRTILPIAVKVDGVDVVQMVSGEGGSTSPAGMFGTSNAGNERLPLFVTVPVSLKGELRRRYGQGRMLWPMLWEGWSLNDVLTAQGVVAYQAVIDEMANRYVGNVIANDMQLINLHGVIPPKAATATRPAQPQVDPTWYDVTSIRLNTTLSFLRSRKAGVGS